MSPALIALISFVVGAVVATVACAIWAWRAMGGEVITEPRGCVHCGARDVPLYGHECIPCLFNRDAPARRHNNDGRDEHEIHWH